MHLSKNMGRERERGGGVSEISPVSQQSFFSRSSLLLYSSSIRFVVKFLPCVSNYILFLLSLRIRLLSSKLGHPGILVSSLHQHLVASCKPTASEQSLTAFSVDNLEIRFLFVSKHRVVVVIHFDWLS